MMCLLLLWCGVLFFYGLDSGELYQTESLRAILGAQMLKSGNWVVPTLYGEPLLTKPPAMYAAIALVSQPFGQVTARTARLPSALAGTTTVLLFYWTFARCLGRHPGLVAAALLPASFLWLYRVPSAEIDLVQLAWVAGALCCFLRALEHSEADPPSAAGAWPWWQLALLCVAGGVLTKWTAPAFFYLTIIPLLWWRGRLRLLLGRPHLASAALASGLCLAWAAAAIAQVGWDDFRDTILREALQRLSPRHHPRPYPWTEIATFPLAFLAANLPWSTLVPLALWRGFGRLWDERSRRLLQLLQCWTWVNLVFWSVVPGHRPRHVLPLQPGLAGLAALVWIAWLDGRLRWRFLCVRPGHILVSVLTCWLVVKLVFVHLVVPARDMDRHPQASGAQVAALVPSEETLYLGRLKDEGILFYYGRPAQRVLDLDRLPKTGRPHYALLTEQEWEQWPSSGRLQTLLQLKDEQGMPIILVAIH
jgi:4-amino-4-deoxy-L-arabinose transferase-like glycosyltransferase